MKKWMMGVAVVGLTACGEGTGDVRFTAYGEDYIEKEIPASAFEDGWSVKFTKFLVTLGELKVANAKGEVAAESARARVYDVHKPGPVEVERFTGLDAKDWAEVSYAIAPSASATAGNATEEDLARLKEGGYAVYLEGSAVKGAETKRFGWGFSQNTLYEHCESTDKGEGLTVADGGEEVVQLTIHGDHLFFDDLQSPDAKMRFDALAAADVEGGLTGPNGEITLEELAQVDLTSLPSGTYGTGGVGNVRNLRDFVNALVRTLGHYQGEGECAPRAR
ncbi:hypothetical protein [Stigmatella aurantiaca]|uniref:Conserved uncharacterized protein n=1 Tax=Stigmatella aurantiaca (strain DW4/3-1) TaxID=378806 RepID=Q08UU3_STIAD|nr:hypothetical protein [Stigmatella aurantiaca]ADO68279.1 conserved uncharacterized protein [Stigmatella aurantiaca DW4/3-1]EAU64255.1 hypothetical protein STIAU_1737 [Stigmatella aurantiaca DW4/3-1]